MQFFTKLFSHKKIKILMVCTANICRSPMAHAILREKVEKKGLSHKIHVDSAGTHVPIGGLLPDKRSLKVLQEQEMTIKKLKTRLLSANDIKKFDYILVMDDKNFAVIQQRYGEGHSNVKFLMEFGSAKADLNVPDPYYGHPNEFRVVYHLIEEACENFLENLITKHCLEAVQKS